MCVRVVKVNGMRGNARADVVYVGRAFAGWPRHPLCNPAALSAYRNRALCLKAYAEHLAKMPDLEKRLAALWEECGHGAKPLGCWCCDWDGVREPAPECHAVTLAQMLRDRFVPTETRELLAPELGEAGA